ncbi:MAG TPA: maltotransferase domain-containing protein, partial [Methylomirabilota bacterium]|nr:maltotransferase domain-containing protein [Methylomirabilota bacterium]
MSKTRRPIAIEHVRPAVDDGRYPAKRIVGDALDVSADIFKEGHDLLAAAIRYRARDDADWRTAPLRPTDNDGWAGAFRLEANTRYRYTVEAWTDTFGSWLGEMRRRITGGQVDLTSELLEGAELIQQAVGRPKAAAARPDVGAGFSRPADADENLRLLEIADML